jgi:hypothetical protein
MLYFKFNNKTLCSLEYTSHYIKISCLLFSRVNDSYDLKFVSLYPDKVTNHVYYTRSLTSQIILLEFLAECYHSVESKFH